MASTRQMPVPGVCLDGPRGDESDLVIQSCSTDAEQNKLHNFVVTKSWVTNMLNTIP